MSLAFLLVCPFQKVWRPLEKPLTKNLKVFFFHREPLSSPEELCVLGRGSSLDPKPPSLPLEGFQVKGLTPRKMVKVQSVLESLRIKIVKESEKGVALESRSTLSAYMVYFRRKRKPICRI